MPRNRSRKIAETMDSKVLVISKNAYYKIQLKLLLQQSPYLEGICYPPISRIYFQQFEDGIIKRVVEFCKYQKIVSLCDEKEIEELKKFAEHTKMIKLRDYLHPRIEAQGGFFPLDTSIDEIFDAESDDDDEVEVEAEEDSESVPICYINTIMIKPSADMSPSDSGERIRHQSYIPQDPLHLPSLPTTPIPPPEIIPSPSPPPAKDHRSLSLTPSSADEAEEGILGERAYESVSYLPDENIFLRPIPAEIGPEKTKASLFQRIRSYFS